jgi:hypothetical protein
MLNTEATLCFKKNGKPKPLDSTHIRCRPLQIFFLKKRVAHAGAKK